MHPFGFSCIACYFKYVKNKQKMTVASRLLMFDIWWQLNVLSEKKVCP